MHALDIYKWLGVSGNRFRKRFQGDETLYNHAKDFWNNLDSDGLIIIGIFLAIGIFWAIYYYTNYNNRPGRRYRPKKWFLWLAITAGASFVLSFLFMLIFNTPSRQLHGSVSLELKIAFGNALYAAIVYFITSVLWCNCWQTNAYRMFKFKK